MRVSHKVVKYAKLYKNNFFCQNPVHGVAIFLSVWDTSETWLDYLMVLYAEFLYVNGISNILIFDKIDYCLLTYLIKLKKNGSQGSGCNVD